jgi:hypothetical protein
MINRVPRPTAVGIVGDRDLGAVHVQGGRPGGLVDLAEEPPDLRLALHPDGEVRAGGDDLLGDALAAVPDVGAHSRPDLRMPGQSGPSSQLNACSTSSATGS